MNARPILIACCCGMLMQLAGVASEDKPPSVDVAQPVEREVCAYETFLGRIEPVEQVEVRARVTGHLTQVNFKPGSRVKKGELLLQIDPRTYEAALQRAEAMRLQAEAKLKRCNADFERAKALLKARAINPEDFHKAEADREEALAAREVSVAEMRRAQLDVEFTRITSPIDGTIGDLKINVGNLVIAEKTALARIISVGKVHAYFAVDERTLLRLRKQIDLRSATVAVGRAGGTSYPHAGTIDFFDNVVDAKTGTIRCRASLANADGELLSGMRVSVRLATSAPYKALLIATTARLDESGRLLVPVVNDKNQLEFRTVEVGARYDGLLEVRKGLSAQDWVLVNAPDSLKAGMTVQPRRVPLKVGD